MNNEEKILEMLGGLLAKFEALDGKMGALDNKVGALDGKVGALDGKVGTLTDTVTQIQVEQQKTNQQLDGIEERLDRVENEVQTTKNIAARIEHDHGQKLKALFDGYVLLHEISVEVRNEIVGIKDEQVQQDVQLTFFKHQKKA